MLPFLRILALIVLSPIWVPWVALGLIGMVVGLLYEVAVLGFVSLITGENEIKNALRK